MHAPAFRSRSCPRSRSSGLAVVVVAAALGCGPEPAPASETGPRFACGPAGDEDAPVPSPWGVDDALRPSFAGDFFARFLPPSAQTHESRATFAAYASYAVDEGGWGTAAPVFFPTDTALDPASVTEGSFVFVDVDDGRVVAGDVEIAAELRFVAVAPRSPLHGDHRHVVLAFTGMSDDAGAAFRRDPRFAEILDAHGALLGEAAALVGRELDDVLVAALYRTLDPHRDLSAAVARVAPLAPSLVVPAPPSTSGRVRGRFVGAAIADALPEYATRLAAASVVVIGTVASADVRREGHFDRAVVDGDAPPTLVDLEAIAIAPDPAVFPPPWPLVVMQHGFNSSNRFVLENAAVFLEHGYAVLGIDAASHGQRGSVVSFFNVEDIRVFRDNLRQTVVDHVQLFTLGRSGQLDIDGAPGADLTGEVLYFGHSMGSLIGTMTAAMLPEATVSVLSAAGGGISRILQSENLRGPIELLVRPALGLTLDDDTFALALPFFSGFAQAVIDPGDPLSYAPLLRADAAPSWRAGVPRVLIQEGVGDRLVGNATTEALAAAADIPAFAAPVEEEAPFSALWRIAPQEFGVPDEVNPHDVFFHIPGVRAQAARYLLSRGAIVVDPAAP